MVISMLERPPVRAHSAQARYVRDVLALHDTLRYDRIPQHVAGDGLCWQVRRPDGLLTLAVRTDQLPHRYLLGLLGFRLAQYLRLGYASADVVYRAAMFCESAANVHPRDIHVVTLDGDTGRILGYVGFGASPDPVPRDPRDPGRVLFHTEHAHDVNLFHRVPPPDGLTTHEVREVKRFVHNRQMSDRGLRLRVSLELLLGAGHAVAALDPAPRVLIGDVEERLALRHLLMLGLDVQLVEGTRPVLPAAEVMHPMYLVRASVKPFVSRVPAGPELQRRIEELDRALAAPDVFGGVRRLAGTLGCDVRSAA
ncbi:MAG TPA: hypothetical protein VJT31_30510 [Rugosimonospora sp.]|nr:hypothetical protein [Rugosimonospora sp.]